MPNLTQKQELFCIEYLVDYNPTQAALRAGYDSDNLRKVGYSLRNNPAIRQRIAEIISERNQQLLVAEEFIIDNLVEVITRCLQGEPVTTYNPEQKTWTPTGDWKFDAANATKALNVLANLIGMDVRQHLAQIEAKKPTPTQGMTKEQFDKLITAVRANASVPYPRT